MSNLAASYHVVGRHVEAAKLSLQVDEMYEKLKHASDSWTVYVFACLRAMAAAGARATDPSPAGAALADAEADQAMIWLTRAVAAGCTDVAVMRSYELKALHGRDDFKNLVADLEAKAKVRKKQEEGSKENRGQKTEDSKKQTASEKK
jgi:hypothetical protein